MRKALMALGVIGCLALFGFIWGSVYYAKGQVLNRYLVARQADGDMMDNLKPYLVWADTKEYMTMDEGRLANFARLTKEEVAQHQEELAGAREEDKLYLTKIGQKFWIFPDYRVAIQPMSLTLETNLAGASLLLNGRQVGTSDSEDYRLTLERLPYSHYEASLEGRYQNRLVTVNKVYDGQPPLLSLRVNFKTFSVTSNIEDGEVFIGDKPIGQIQEGRYEVVDFPVSDGVSVQVKRRFADGDLASDKVAVDDLEPGASVDLSVTGLLEEAEASEQLLAAFNHLFAYYQTGADPADLTKTFSKGAQNGFYDLLKTSIATKTRTDSRKPSSLAIQEVYLSDLRQVGRASYVVHFSAQYAYYYDKSTDPAHRSQGHIYQNLSGQFTLKKEGAGYLIVDDKTMSLNLDSEDNQIKLPVQPKSVAGLPPGLAGTWELEEGGETFYLLIKSDGQVETRVLDDAESGQTSIIQKAHLSGYKEVVPGLYILEFSRGDISAFGLSGLGGANVTYATGVDLSGNQFTLAVWATTRGQDFDYEQYQLGRSWTKSKGLPSPSQSSSSATASSSRSSKTSETSSDAAASSDEELLAETQTSTELTEASSEASGQE